MDGLQELNLVKRNYKFPLVDVMVSEHGRKTIKQYRDVTDYYNNENEILADMAKEPNNFNCGM